MFLFCFKNIEFIHDEKVYMYMRNNECSWSVILKLKYSSALRSYLKNLTGGNLIYNNCVYNCKTSMEFVQ